jgi:hypothetical protein
VREIAAASATAADGAELAVFLGGIITIVHRLPLPQRHQPTPGWVRVRVKIMGLIIIRTD